MNFDDLIAEKVIEQIAPTIIEEIVKNIDTKKIAAAATKAMTDSVKEMYWTDILNDAVDERVTKLFSDKIITALKGV